MQARKKREVRSRREEHTVSLVGYTNAGKSTLMNALTGAGVYVEDKLFSTLDTRTRQWHLKDWGRVLLSDTVGFIRDLPHHSSPRSRRRWRRLARPVCCSTSSTPATQPPRSRSRPSR